MPAKEVTRFQVNAPPNTVFGSAVNSLRTGTARAAQPCLPTARASSSSPWMNAARRCSGCDAFDSFDAIPLAGSDGASQPFWAPDARSIGFFVGKKLKRLEATGGSPLHHLRCRGRHSARRNLGIRRRHHLRQRQFAPPVSGVSRGRRPGAAGDAHRTGCRQRGPAGPPSCPTAARSSTGHGPRAAGPGVYVASIVPGIAPKRLPDRREQRGLRSRRVFCCSHREACCCGSVSTRPDWKSVARRGVWPRGSLELRLQGRRPFPCRIPASWCTSRQSRARRNSRGSIGTVACWKPSVSPAPTCSRRCHRTEHASCTPTSGTAISGSSISAATSSRRSRPVQGRNCHRCGRLTARPSFIGARRTTVSPRFSRRVPAVRAKRRCSSRVALSGPTQISPDGKWLLYFGNPERG